MKLLLLLVLFPVCLHAQEVQPVLSKDYQALIERDSLHEAYRFRQDTTNSIRNTSLQSPGYFSGGAIRRVQVRNGYVRIQRAYSRVLRIGGNFSSTVEIKSANRQPALQNNFVQGSPENGQPAWRGPETGEPFSYGPGVSAMEFDGSNYAWDINGRLVSKGSGNGKAAQAYGNHVLRTAALTAQSFSLHARYLEGGAQKLAAVIKLGQTRESTFIINNKNKTDNLMASLSSTIDWLTISGTYEYLQDRFSNSNRNGFLNRVYQHSLLTPISFDNGQGYLIGLQQRRYSPVADNPNFLLTDNGNTLGQVYKTGSLSFEKKGSISRFTITQSAENRQENSAEGYKPGTTFFANGIAVNRRATDRNYFLKAEGKYNISYGDQGKIRSEAIVNYIYASNRTVISYTPGMDYRYQRSSQDVFFNYQTKYNGYDIEAALNLGDKFYVSNTTATGSWFLPTVSGFMRFPRMFDLNLNARISGSFNRFNNELPVNRSFSYFNLLQYSTMQAAQYFPVTEINSFDNLSPIRHREWTGKLELFFGAHMDFYAEIFRRSVFDDVFPVLQNGMPVLKNVASHRNDAVELQLAYHTYRSELHTDTRLTFYAGKARVTEIADGYNFAAVAGFSDVYKALVKGEAPGVIVGSSYLKDAHNNRVIGNDGFPMVNTTPAVLGNPLPDFVMKLNHAINWKRLTLSFDWEWKKGGVNWNGTQAVLDYYGRSETSGLLRNTTGYIFTGVQQNGHVNTVPVRFYDPALPVESNRWTRYGYSGGGEEYMQKSDWLRLNNMTLCYKIAPRRSKYVQNISFSVYAGNWLLWSPYKGADASQLLYDLGNTSGLDFFNLPSAKNAGFNLAVQF